MARVRFSLASLIALVCFVAVFLGALRLDWSLCTFFTARLTVLVVCSAAVAGIFGRERTRRIWLPFAIFAGGYWFGIVGWGLYLERYAFSFNWIIETFEVSSPPQVSDHEFFAYLFESVFALVVGLLGTTACNIYWAFRPPVQEKNQTDAPP